MKEKCESERTGPLPRRIRRCGYVLLLSALLSWAPHAAAGSGETDAQKFPVDMDGLVTELSRIAQASGAPPDYPRTVSYRYLEYDLKDDTLTEEKRSITLEKKPRCIVPHSVGLAEILWGICPRDRIALVHRDCTNPRFSFLAGRLPPSVDIYGTRDAEIVIGHKPDLVLVPFYSDDDFKERLRGASIPFVEMGFFDDLSAIEEQIRLVGELIGEPARARSMIEKMRAEAAKIRRFVENRRGSDPLKVVYYDEMGYVAGLHSTFDAICRQLDVENLPAAHGLEFFKQVDYERLLKWDPDMIVVPRETNLDERLRSNPIMKNSQVVRNGGIRKVPSIYLLASSQYMVASLNYFAGIFYGSATE